MTLTHPLRGLSHLALAAALGLAASGAAMAQALQEVDFVQIPADDIGEMPNELFDLNLVEQIIRKDER